MILSEWTKNIKAVKLQRNYSLCLNVFLSATLLLLLMILLRTANSHTTVLVPAALTQHALIGSKGVSDTYLIQWTEFIAALKLNATPETVAESHNALLPYVSSATYGKFKAQLAKEQEKVINDEISTVYYPKETKVIDTKNHKTRTTGLLKIYIGETLHESVNVSYELSFEFINNRLLLRSMSEVERA